MNPVAIARAAAGNIKAGHVTSGGSTITMQVIRMSRGRERNIGQKIIEAILATRLELRCSKRDILSLYASHAPFGGNVVGLEAASWRYYGRPPDELSWGEAATLAVLPNAPAEIHPGKNRTRLLEKRNRLLGTLYKHGHIDSLDFVLACDEPLPGETVALPQEAHHLTEYYWKTSPGKRIRTTIDIHLQRQAQAIVNQWNNEFSQTGIYDLAAVVEDVRTGETLAYIGNANPDHKRPGSEVDIIRSPRSTGSILKPLLYCALLQDGEILPKTLLPDVPININGFSPQNFNRQFYGAVPADEALARSLNVPSVHLRDAWAVGVTADYAVGVWAGNAQGQGVPGLTGTRTAGPVMFDIFNLLPSKEYDSEYSRNGWFKEPVYGDYIVAEVCRESGCLKGVNCKDSYTLMLPRKSVRSEPCPYHKVVDGAWTFILPPSMEWYYRQHHPEYAPVVPKGKADSSPMEFIYPESGAVIYIPRQLDGSIAGITFNLAHRTPSVNVFWHLDNEYVGQTQMIHQMTLKPSPGRHTVTAVDDSGNSISVGFTVAENKTLR